MKKIFKPFLTLILTSSLFIGCTDLNDVLYDKIPADNFPENDIQADLMTIPVYAPLQELCDAGCWWFAQEVTSDEMVCPTRDADWDDSGKWRVLHTHTWDNQNETVNSMWSRFYKGIFEANKLIESTMPAAVPGSAAEVTVAKLKVMRAYYYYLLIDNYGDVPYVTSFSNAPDMPMKEKRAVIYDSIVAQVKEAALLIPSAPGTKTAVTKGMAYSLLAKLYLNAQVYSGTAHWAEAETACDSVIACGYTLESNPLAPFVTENSLSPENIFTIPFDEDAYKGFNLHMRTLHYKSNETFNLTAGPWNGFCAMEDHYNSYDDNDLRKKGYFLVGQQYGADGTELSVETDKLILNPFIPALDMDASYTQVEIKMSGARVQKFEIKLGATDNLSNDFPLFRLADILLMKAEAQVRQGKFVDVKDLDKIRTRAGLAAWGAVTLDEILAERGRELFWEAHRRQDLIRFGKFGEAWWEKTASAKDRETFPIPQWVIDANPNLAK